MDPSKDLHEYCNGGFDPDDIVISGIAGRFPDCNNIGELKESLYNKKNLITFSDERFKKGTCNIPYSSSGIVNNLDKFDNNFFRIPHSVANKTDPGARVHMEVVYEAIADAGVDALDLRGMKIGIFNATTQEDASTIFSNMTHCTNLLALRPLTPNRTSYVLDFTGGDTVDLGFIDGFDMWQTLVNDFPSPRKHMLQNLDPIYGTSAFRLLDLKVVNGTSPNRLNYWYGPTGFKNFDHPANYEYVFKEGSLVKDILQEMGMWIVKDPNDIYQRIRITCEYPPPSTAYTCKADKKPCLFNITADPCEYTDLAEQNPEIVKKMMNIIYKYKVESVKPQSKPSDRRADPLCHSYKFVPWLDPEHYDECEYATGSEITYKKPITLS